jgi:hypothetical protein
MLLVIYADNLFNAPLLIFTIQSESNILLMLSLQTSGQEPKQGVFFFCDRRWSKEKYCMQVDDGSLEQRRLTSLN